LRQRDFAFLQATTSFAKLRQYKKLPKAVSRNIDNIYKVIRFPSNGYRQQKYYVTLKKTVFRVSASDVMGEIQ
jgi:glutathione peroxidase-family protein